MQRRMLPLARADLSNVEAVFTDVDGTLTTAGRLRASTVAAIEALVLVGVRVVLVSGRPAGWGEAWARELPVKGVIVENGGLYFAWRRSRLVRVYAEPEGQRQKNRRALQRHVAAALKRVAGARLSSDSAYTEVDLAIDYAEDSSLGDGAAAKLEAFLRRRGVNAVRSSVHVNCWLGDFDKASTVRAFLKQEWKAKVDERLVYVGDSLNDAPMFASFPLSVGVANVRDVLDVIEHKPRYVTKAREGRGFEELTQKLLLGLAPHRARAGAVARALTHPMAPGHRRGRR